MVKQFAVEPIIVRGLLVLSILLTLDGLQLGPLPVLAQEITDAFVRGTDVALRAEPAASAELVTTLQEGDAIRITGDAVTESGETKPVTVDTLGVTRVWFVPVEDVETGEVGWIAEVFIDPHRLIAFVPTAPPVAPENTPDPTVSPAPTATQPTQTVDAVDQAKAWMHPSCEDGIGRTFTSQESKSAGASFRISLEVVACAGSILDPSLIAQCSPPMEGTREETGRVICLVSIFNFGESTNIKAAADDFSLLSNTDRYEVNIDVSRRADPELNIASQPVPVLQGGSVSGLVAFDVPDDMAKVDMVLQWTGVGPVNTDNGVLPGLQILVHVREPEVAEALPFVQSAPPVGSQGAEAPREDLSYSGTSDAVIGPLHLESGLYEVSARYAGDENFIVRIRYADGTSELLVDDVGGYSGKSTFFVETSTVVLEVEGAGRWGLQIEKVM